MKKITLLLKAVLLVFFVMSVVQVDARGVGEINGNKKPEIKRPVQPKENPRTRKNQKTNKMQQPNVANNNDVELERAIQQSLLENNKPVQPEWPEEIFEMPNDPVDPVELAKQLSLQELANDGSKSWPKEMSKETGRQGLGLVDQLTEKLVLEAMTVGESYTMPNNQNILIQRLTNKFLVVQLPANSQTGARCGTHAYINSKYLCEAKNPDVFVEFLNSNLLIKEVNESAGVLKGIRSMNVGYVNDNNLLSNDYNKYVGTENMMSYEEMLELNGDKVSSIVSGICRTIIAKEDTREKLLKQKVICDASKRFTDTRQPEVFIVNTGGHWVTIRIEHMSNGMVGIILVDSIWKFGTEAVDKIAVYSLWLEALAAIFA
ncbi:hypothetical protein KKA53_03795 [Candidatus Dependentiae bacterium]|nr:hypothetical protein [Candidatus Dependentiae bacterium]